MRTNSKILWLILLMLGLTIFSPPRLLAQEKIDLALRLVDEYYPKVTPGKDNAFFLEIRNVSNKAITNIRLNSTKPEGWVVEFKPGSIDYLGPGSVQTIDINIKPASGAGKGKYTVTVMAEANETRKVMSIMTSVETGTTVWLWIGVAVAALVVAGFVIIFMRFGRQ